MTEQISSQAALSAWRRALERSLREGRPDLSSRQMALLLAVYTTPPPHTVRGVAERLAISKPAVVRAIDSLAALGFLRRRRDDADRRNVLLQRTVQGAVFLSEFASIIAEAWGEE